MRIAKNGAIQLQAVLELLCLKWVLSRPLHHSARSVTVLQGVEPARNQTQARGVDGREATRDLETVSGRGQ